ncbi:hypothetical protein [Burkholderia gladioli]|uniref:hypothetical protein n=1 Tax=Burkholderia gladioli TaxID=28095 RepID=UPI001FC7DAE5|nr:hypothetical protein [Burkholderia gladioli]
MSHIATAHRWRQENGYVGRSGVVVLYSGEVQGWVNVLRNPEHWRPGCIAVDEAGRQWMTVAGTEREGALLWLPVEQIPDNVRSNSGKGQLIIQIEPIGAEVGQNLVARNAFVDRLCALDGMDIDGTGAGSGTYDVFLNTTDTEAPALRARVEQVVADAGLTAAIRYIPRTI